MILSGASDADVLEFYKKTRFVSDEKSSLALEIAKREAGILSRLDPVKGYSLYIGIPFCPTRCLYCSFLSNPIAKWQNRVAEYLSCIEKELAFTKEAFAGKKIDTIYIGGGTPTALSEEELKVLMDLVNGFLSDEDRKNLLEFTVEAGRPDSITAGKLRVLKQAGVSRISVNPQTMNEETLKRIGRAHTVEETVKAFLLAREEGFDNINMDLILGLPGEGLREVEYTLSEVEKLAPDSLTVHSLAIKRSALMKDWLRDAGSTRKETGNTLKNADNALKDTGNTLKDANSAQKEEGTAPGEILLAGHNIMTDMAAAAYASAARLNLNPYYLYRQKNIAGNLENVGFAKEGLYGIYNILMMEEVQSIVALGAGTVSKRVLSEKEISRCDTAKDIGLYMDGIDEMIRRKEELFCR
jgi:oxygen-independent coproporphyrinogen-3 oxidase